MTVWANSQKHTFACARRGCAVGAQPRVLTEIHITSCLKISYGTRACRQCHSSQSLLRWETGQPPTEDGVLMHISPENDIADILRDMAPHAQRLMMELHHRMRYEDFVVLLGFFDLMRRWGMDPDPQGTLRMMVGNMAYGPDLSVDDAIRIRCAFQRPDCLDLSWLQVTDEAVAVIPDTVTGLALVNAPVTDACIPHLLRLTALKRLNVAGTRITDNGLVGLGGLPNLEWVCVNRTEVTDQGVTKLKAIRPAIEVMIGAEPGSAPSTTG